MERTRNSPMKSGRTLLAAVSFVALTTAAGFSLFHDAHAQLPPTTTKPVAPAAVDPAAQPPAQEAVPVDKPAPDKKDPNLRRLSPNFDLWLDTKNKKVVMEGTVCLV